MRTLYAIAEIHSAEALKFKQYEEFLKRIPHEAKESNPKLKQIIKEIKQYCLLADALQLESTYDKKVEETKNLIKNTKLKAFFCEGEGRFETNISFFDSIGYKGKKIFLDECNRIEDISQTYESLSDQLIEGIETKSIKREDARKVIYNFKYYANKMYNEELEGFWREKILKDFDEPSIIKCGRNHLISTSGDQTNFCNILKENGINIKVVIDEVQLLNPVAKKFNEYLLTLQ